LRFGTGFPIVKAVPNPEPPPFRKCGASGVLLPAVTLGLWHNFGAGDDPVRARKILLRAWELGVTHFDLANNYGLPKGSAEVTFGKILKKELKGERDRMFISTKAGYRMWEGPYGDGGSRKYLVTSCDQSLRRMGLDYVDLFYSHRFDPETPLEETMGALDYLVRSGRALYVGISSYDPEQTRRAPSSANSARPASFTSPATTCWTAGSKRASLPSCGRKRSVARFSPRSRRAFSRENILPVFPRIPGPAPSTAGSGPRM